MSKLYRVAFTREGKQQEFIHIHADTIGDAGMVADAKLGRFIEGNFYLDLIQEVDGSDLDAALHEAMAMGAFHDDEERTGIFKQRPSERMFWTWASAILLGVTALCYYLANYGLPV